VVRVLVGKRGEERRFFGFWVEFEGEEVASYEKEDDFVYTLYKATAYNEDVYRVYISNETDPQSPVYELHPFEEDPAIQGIRPDYTEPYRGDEVVDKYPLFIKRAYEKKDEKIDSFQIFPGDPQR
jgi:hypothetical protein